MMTDSETGHGDALAALHLLVGRFHRKTGQYGEVAVVGQRTDAGVNVIADPKRVFARDGLVETHGPGHHAGLKLGDWVEFDVQRNTRPRAHEYKVHHLRRLPRYAVLPEATIDHYRVLLTRDGWRGESRPGLWALRITNDKVLLVELEQSKDGALRISRDGARDVKWFRHEDEHVVRLKEGNASDEVFIAPKVEFVSSFDWSDEADHIARVIRSLADSNDPRVDDLITWLDLHFEEGTGRVSASAGDNEAALDALRSGALASRLRADRHLMKAYLDAAVGNDAVRAAVADYAREGDGAERDRLTAEFEQGIAQEKTQRLDDVSAEIDAERTAARKALNAEVVEWAVERGRERQYAQSAAQQAHSDMIAAFEVELEAKRGEFDRAVFEAEEAANLASSSREAAEAELARTLSELEAARDQLREAVQEVDRVLAIGDRLATAATTTVAVASAAASLGRQFIVHPMASLKAKSILIERQPMLTDKGKDEFRKLLVLLLSGELPFLTGPDAMPFLRIVESVICPGRLVSIEADPTLISIEDLWARPGSGAPTLLASASEAAAGGAVLVVINGVERSGARFWVPALREALSVGGLPRGLLVCCTVSDQEHDETLTLPADLFTVSLGGAIDENAYLAAPVCLSGSRVAKETLDPGPMPADLSEASAFLASLGEKPGLMLSMRLARLLVEARALLNDEQAAKSLVLELVKSLPTIETKN